MSKGKTTTGAVVIIGAALAVVVGIKAPSEISKTKAVPMRQALLDETCSASAATCRHKYKVNGSMCMCCTEATGKLANEIEDHETIVPAKAFKFLICKSVGPPEEGKPERIAGFFPFTGPPPGGYACTPILPRGAKEASVHGVKSRLSEELVDRCCVDCDEGSCFVEPGEWGMCPYCLLDDNCADYCL